METRQIMFIERGKVELCTFPAVNRCRGVLLKCIARWCRVEPRLLLGLIASPKYPMQLGYSGVATVLDNGGARAQGWRPCAVYHAPTRRTC